ncbi:MAG: hypothetical protein B7Y35_10075 [Sphingomonadales bacterium 28-64-96]|nr:MAG: hypothetical protein B7Y35_10075 [Sphingomonadales bacterium 28-64-96]
MKSGLDGERFLAAFARLKAAVSDDPGQLAAAAEGNPDLQSLCDELAQLVKGFEAVEDWSRFAFSHNIPVAAAEARREYEERWRSAVTDVANREVNAMFADMLADLLADVHLDDDGGTAPPYDALKYDMGAWQDEAADEAARIERIIDYAFDRLSLDDDGDLPWLESSLEAWNRLVKACGLNIEGALWRRRALPHVLVPSHVAKHYGKSKASLYRRLDQAGKAFVFGAPLAALALQRAVIEEVLATHWGAEKGKVQDANLPELAWDARATRLKRLANEALHGDPETLRPEQLDRAIIENFGLLRLLIEKAPQDLRAHQGKAT